MVMNAFMKAVRFVFPFGKNEPPRVRASALGTLYMDPEEFFKSPKVQAQIDDMIRLAEQREKTVQAGTNASSAHTVS
jgi:hypothetical protein